MLGRQTSDNSIDVEYSSLVDAAAHPLVDLNDIHGRRLRVLFLRPDTPRQVLG